VKSLNQKTENIKEIYYNYQELNANLKFISDQLEYLNSDQIGISITKKTLDALKETKSGEEIILPIGNYAFIKARIENPNVILISIGKDVLVEKNIDESMAYIRKIEEDNLRAKNILEDQSKQIKEQIDKITPILEKYIKESEEKKLEYIK